MTTLADDLLAGSAPEPRPDSDTPRSLGGKSERTDLIFRWSTRSVAAVVLVITAGIGVFLGYQMIPTFHHYGLRFFTENQWNPEQNVLGISAMVLGTVEIAVIALVISVPIAILMALYIVEYSPGWLKGTLVSLIDLMAAIPSIVYGLWGLLFVEPHAIFVARFLNQYFGWLPIFHVGIPGSTPNAPAFEQSDFGQSAFIAGVVVSMMVIPMGCAVMRGVFDQAPIGEREAALALGSTRWGMIRAVVLPFGRGGIIGGSMLALGRALGETVAVYLILSPDFSIKFRPLESGAVSVSYVIANNFGDATSVQLSALLAAGFVLFMITLIVNTFAAILVNRSRSGAATEI
jgi:phosphate transport system permease protein